jgi:predicted DNA binding CopG/RHH family protein
MPDARGHFSFQGDLIIQRNPPIRISDYSQANDNRRKAPISALERPMKTTKLPKTDSIQELAKFWQAHDLTDFEDELEEVKEPVFSHDDPIQVRLPVRDANAVRRLAESKGISQTELVRQWVREKLARNKRSAQAKS